MGRGHISLSHLMYKVCIFLKVNPQTVTNSVTGNRKNKSHELLVLNLNPRNNIQILKLIGMESQPINRVPIQRMNAIIPDFADTNLVLLGLSLAAHAAVKTLKNKRASRNGNLKSNYYTETIEAFLSIIRSASLIVF